MSIDQAVISCPQCLRQYEIDAITDRVVAMCGACKAHFIALIPRLSGPAGEVVVLEKEIEPHVNFFKEACETMARNASIGLRESGDAITPERMIWLVERVTSDDFISNCLEVDPENMMADYMTYFTKYLPRRSRYARDMLRSAFLGVLGGIDWEPVKVRD